MVWYIWHHKCFVFYIWQSSGATCYCINGIWYLTTCEVSTDQFHYGYQRDIYMQHIHQTPEYSFYFLFIYGIYCFVIVIMLDASFLFSFCYKTSLGWNNIAHALKEQLRINSTSNMKVQFKRFNVATTIYSTYLNRCTDTYIPIHLC